MMPRAPDGSAADELRFIPEVRSADLERSRRPTTQVVLYASEYADLDHRSLTGRTQRVHPWTAWTWAFRGRWRVIEMPEPLWLRALPFTSSVGLAIRLADLVLRRQTLVVTYAMENNAPERLLRPLPAPARRVVAWVIRAVAGVVYDRIAFASPAAATRYREMGVLPPSAATREFVELLPRCECDRSQRDWGTVVFLGALEARKGLPDLLAAWESIPSGRNGWTLRIAGAGPYEAQAYRAAAADPSIDVVGIADRPAVHALLGSAAILVLPSRREGRWCEQIGLPIVEGLAHGCRIVATPDTGLADWLRDHGHIVLPEGFTTRELADGLTAALTAARLDVPLAPNAVEAALPAADVRVLAEDWMRGVDDAHTACLKPTCPKGSARPIDVQEEGT